MFEQELKQLVKEAVREALAELGYRPGAAAADEDLVKLKDVRPRVDVGVSTLKKWIAAGQLPSYGKGRSVRVRLGEVRACFARRRAAVADPSTPGAKANAILATLPRRAG